MTAIRPLERRDLPAVARLHAESASGDERFERRLTAFLERTLFDHPWADPEIPSLVYEENDGIVGFLGSNVRRMRFGDETIRMACSAHLIAHPRARSAGVGGLLLRTYLGGPQDLTVTDGANVPVQRMWEALGGATIHLSCLSFVLPLRPAELATHLTLGRRGHALESAARPIAAMLDRPLSRRLRAREPRAGERGIRSERLTPEAVVAALPRVSRGLTLVPAYDVEYLRWLFGELATVGSDSVFPDRVERGPLWAELVREREEPIGWYVCHLRKGGMCRVLQLAATAGRTDAVVDALVRRAHADGAAGIYGRLEPRLLAPVAERRCIIRPAPARMLAHARDSSMLDAIRGGDALLTRMDAEWW